MGRKITFWVLWVGVICYAFLFAPPNKPDTLTLIQNLSTGNWQGINPLIVALFNIMGIWPAIYSCVLFIDGKGQKIPAWPFLGLSFAVGAFALLPYLGLREPNQTFFGRKNLFIKFVDSRWNGLILTFIAGSLVAYGLLGGNWVDFIEQWKTSRFIHVMSLDFCLLCLLFPAVLGDDMARRQVENPLVFWAVSLVPLFGPLAYLCLRPPLLEALRALPPSQQPATN